LRVAAWLARGCIDLCLCTLSRPPLLLPSYVRPMQPRASPYSHTRVCAAREGNSHEPRAAPLETWACGHVVWNDTQTHTCAVARTHSLTHMHTRGARVRAPHAQCSLLRCACRPPCAGWCPTSWPTATACWAMRCSRQRCLPAAPQLLGSSHALLLPLKPLWGGAPEASLGCCSSSLFEVLLLKPL